MPVYFFSVVDGWDSKAGVQHQPDESVCVDASHESAHEADIVEGQERQDPGEDDREDVCGEQGGPEEGGEGAGGGWPSFGQKRRHFSPQIHFSRIPPFL